MTVNMEVVALAKPQPLREVQVEFTAQHATYLPATANLVVVGEGRRLTSLACTMGQCGSHAVKTTQPDGHLTLEAIWLPEPDRAVYLGPVLLFLEGAEYRGVVVVPVQ